MSNFPNKDTYNNKLSQIFLKKLKNHGITTDFPLIIKKEKNQYLYDIDMNKYCDFFLNNGSVVLGHNNKTLTQYIKDAISIGTESVFLNKFYYKLVKLFSEVTEVKNIQFYSSMVDGFSGIFKNLSFDTIGVNTAYLYEFFRKKFPFLKIIYPVKKKVDFFIFEPIDFENDLSDFDFKSIKAKNYCSFEGRTAFRISNGFYYTINEVDYVISGNIITNGINSAVIISKNKIEENVIPAFLSVAILETIKYYRRHHIEFINFDEKFFKSQRGGIIKLNSKIEIKKALQNGIFINGDIAFLSILHTKHDEKRLLKAITG